MTTRRPLCFLLTVAIGRGSPRLPLASSATASPDSVLVLRGGSRLDPRTGTLQRNGVIVVRHGKVVAVRPPDATEPVPQLGASRGIKALAHTPVVDSTAAAALHRSGVRVISTLASLGPRPGGAEVVASFRRLRAAGVPIVLGTDAGVLAHGRNARELVALTDAGLTPAEALRAATTVAASLLDRSDLGEIEVGALADFVVVKGDPLQDITLLQHPEMVIQGGRTVQ